MDTVFSYRLPARSTQFNEAVRQDAGWMAIAVLKLGRLHRVRSLVV